MNVGDKVSWTKVSKRGRSISMRHLKGEIVAIRGDTATVKYGGNHRKIEIDMDNLRLAGEKGQLTEFVEAMAAANRTAT